MTFEASGPTLIGPFWFVSTGDAPSWLEGLGVPVHEVPAITGFRTVETAHAEHWPLIVRRHRELWGVEYEAFPRGRVNYVEDADRFLLFANEQLLDAPFLDVLVHAWRLPRERLEVSPDPHYHLRRRLPSPRLP